MGHLINVTAKDKKSPSSHHLRFIVEIERETDGRWIAEIPEIPGALAYGVTKEEAVSKAYAIALRAVADEVEQSHQDPPESISLERALA